MVEYNRQEHKKKNLLTGQQEGVDEYQRHPETTGT